MKRVIWVDDDPLLSRPFKQELEIRGFDLIYLESCAQYLDFIDNGGPADLFIVDLVMKPEGRITNLASNYGLETGVPLAFETRRSYPQTPILVFTNTANLNAREEAKKKLSILDKINLVPKSRMTQAMDFAKLVSSLLESGETGVSVQVEGESSTVGELLLDAFISYASEDRDSLAKPLAVELCERGYRVWFDEFELSVGDSLREKIDAGLASSRYGIVIFSKAFFQKNWPQRELAGLTAKEVVEGKSILPIWHGVTKQEVLRFSPTLADKVALDSSNCGIPELADAIVHVLKRGR